MARIGMILAGGLGKRMKSTKPKVLHEVGGVPMVLRAIEAMREAQMDQLVAVLSHASELVSSVLPPYVDVVTQEKPRGTASALMDSPQYLAQDENVIVVSFGDMPWLEPCSASKLAQAIEQGADAAVLTYEFDDPPHFGRIVCDSEGTFQDIVQYRDCSEEQLKIKRLDAGMFAFRAKAVKPALSLIGSNNAAGEVYLTDVPGRIVEQGGTVACIDALRLEEALGVNDPRHLKFAEQLTTIRESEDVLHLADDIYDGIPRVYP